MKPVEPTGTPGADRPGPFARPAAARSLAALVVLALVATAWVGLARRRDDPPDRSSSGDEPLTTGPPSAPGLPTAPPPERGGVLPLGGEGGLPEGWREEAGSWARDAGGLLVTEAPATGTAIAVTDVDALPWATVSFAGTAGPGGWGVVFGYANANDHFAVVVEGTTARLLRIEGATEAELAREEITPGDEALIAVDVSDRNVAIHVGTTVLPSVQVPTEEAARVVGVRASAGADLAQLRWASIGVRARPALPPPLVARGYEVTEMTPDEARTHLGP